MTGPTVRHGLVERVARAIEPSLWGYAMGYPEHVHSDETLLAARQAALAKATAALAASGIEEMRGALASFLPDAVKVLNELGDGEYVQSAHHVSTDIGVPEKRVKEVHRALRTLGFADFGTLTREDDGAMVGSGYWITQRGSLLAAALSLADGMGGEG
jgi:hypothetical protein